jgi:hypothetical protein
MLKQFKCIIGLLLALTSVWLGAYGLHVLPEWTEVPILVTMLACAGLGVAITLEAVV